MKMIAKLIAFFALLSLLAACGGGGMEPALQMVRGGATAVPLDLQRLVFHWPHR